MTNQRISCFQFDDVCVDPRSFKVLKADGDLALEPKTFLLLTFLIENRDRLVEKRELLDVIWKDVAVTENALTREIGKLRRVLGDDPKASRYIQTVHTRGYRFVAAVQVIDNAPEPSASELPLPDVAPLEPPSPHGPRAEFRRLPLRHLSFLAPRSLVVALSLVALLVVAAFLVRRPAGSTVMPSALHGTTTLAVLPFRSLGGDAGDKDFGLGMADALITRLSNSAQLTTESVSTVLHYADPRKDSLSIGRAMGVDYILEGKFQKSGTRLRFTVQLICIACNGKSRWAATFDETSGDLFAIQDSISQKVVAALPLELSGDEQKRILKRETGNPRAQMAFSKARLFRNEDTRESLEKSIEFGQLAVSIDPGYAPAWAELSDSYRRREWYGASPTDFLPQVRNAIARAQSLDDSGSYTHVMLGLIAFQYDLDLATAEREYTRARQLQPSLIHQSHSRFLLTTHRVAEAEFEYQQFIRMAPFSVQGRANFAEFLFLTGQYSRALDQIHQTLGLRQDHAFAHELLGLVYEQQGLPDKAAGEFQRAIELSQGYKGLASLGHLYAVAGKHAEVQSVLQKLEEQRKHRYVSPFELALVHEGTRDETRVLSDLEDAHTERSLAVQSLLFDPRLKGLREEPGYREFVLRIGLK